ncbi:hypothetical protein AKJ16_DCAP27247 [Drosera capensis]
MMLNVKKDPPVAKEPEVRAILLRVRYNFNRRVSQFDFPSVIMV